MENLKSDKYSRSKHLLQAQVNSMSDISDALETTKTSAGQQFMINLSQQLEEIITLKSLNERQSDLARFYFELTVQDEISSYSFDSIDKINCLAQEDDQLRETIELIDELVGTAIAEYEEYDIDSLREEYALLLKKKFLSEEDDERIGFILRLALTDEVVRQMVEDVDDAFLASSDCLLVEESDRHKDYMAKVIEKVGREDLVRVDTGLRKVAQPSIALSGREKDILNILENLKSSNVLLIHGEGGIGKTSLCRALLSKHFEQYIEFSIADKTSNLAAVESLIEGQLSAIGETPSQNFQGSWRKLQCCLKTRQIGVLVDNLETILDSSGAFLNSFKKYEKLLRFLSSPEVKSTTLVTSRKRLANPSFSLREYELKGLSKDYWHGFFQSSGIKVHIDDLKWLHQAHLGNPKAMELLCGKVTERKDFSILNYCFKLRSSGDAKNDTSGLPAIREEKDSQNLQELVSTEFDELVKSNDLSARQLLIRLGCYRYQEIAAHLDIDALKVMLWDIPEYKKETVIQVLINRFFINFDVCRGYALHPSIRRESYTRLLDSNDWITANTMAASYWTNKVEKIETSEHALQALEAYYHYMNIEDYRSAANVLIHKRKNAFGTNESLVRSLYKFGLMIHAEQAIKGVKKKDISLYQTAKLTHTLAAMAWLQGDIDKSLKRCSKVHKLVNKQQDQEANNISKISGKTDFAIINLNAYLTDALCYLGLWRLEEALSRLDRVVEIASRIDAEKFKPCASFYIAYIHSLEEPKCDDGIARSISKSLFERWNKDKMPSWLTEYRLYYLGLTFTNIGETDKAYEIHNAVLNNQFHSRYEQAKIKHFNGLACYYRKIGDFDNAIANHGEAITRFQSVGARIDLAEAYFQQAISYKMAKQPKHQIQSSLNKALAIYEDMNAEFQKKRIQAWMHLHNCSRASAF